MGRFGGRYIDQGKRLIDGNSKRKTQVIASHHSEEAPPPANEIISEIEDYVSYGDMVKNVLSNFWIGGRSKDIRSRMGVEKFEIKASLMGIGSGGETG